MKHKIFTIYILGIFVVGMIISIIHTPASFSDAENRYLEEKPKLVVSDILSGTYEKNFDKYVSDQFAFRNTAISLKTQFQMLTLQTDNSRVYFGDDYYFIDKQGKIDSTKLDTTINSINALSERTNKNITTMIVPSSALVNADKLPDNVSSDRSKALNNFNQNISSNINNIKLLDTLKNVKFQSFYRNDHHWTSDSAYVAYTKWCEAEKIKPISKDKFKIKVVSNDFLGATYSKAIPFNYKKDKIVKYEYDNQVSLTYSDGTVKNSIYEESALSKKDKYTYFTGQNDSIIKVHTSTNNGKSLLLVKDSFANSYLSFLTLHYENIYVVDPRYYNDTRNFLELYNIDDILVLYNIDNLMEDDYLSLFLDTIY